MKKSFLFYFIFFYLFSCVSGNSKKKEMDPYVEDSLLSIEKSSKKENLILLAQKVKLKMGVTSDLKDDEFLKTIFVDK